MATLCVYCGSNVGNNPRFIKAAQAVGRLLAQKNHTLVYGGARLGLMGVVADEVLAEGGKVIGIIPELLMQAKRELVHEGLTELHIVDSMHERKHKMASLADGFLALPGGIGTLEEIMEAFTWTQIGIHPKACALLNIDQFYQPLVEMLSTMVKTGFLHQEQLAQLIVEDHPETIMRKIWGYQHRLLKKWEN